MKKIALSIILLLSLFSISLKSQNQQEYFIGDFEEAINTELTKAEMWVNLKKWTSSKFNNYKYVVDLEDKENGVMIIKWTSRYASKTSEHIKLTAESTYQIDVREGKYRVKVYDGFVKVTPNIDRTSTMTTRALEEARGDLQLVLSVSEGEFKSQTSWRMDEKYIDIINFYKSELSETPKYKNEKRRRKTPGGRR